MPVHLGRLAKAFGLPSLDLVEYRFGASGVWRLRCVDGDLALSARPGSAPRYVLDELRTAGQLERRAMTAGLDVVPFLEPREPAVGLAAEVDDCLVVLHRWAETVRDGDSAVGSEWLGETLARLHRLWPDPATDEAELSRAYGVHPLADWRRWVEDAAAAGLGWASAVSDAMDAVAEATELSLAALRLNLPRCVTHRDLNPPNLLHTAMGPLLCDFGYAGLDVPWLEAVDAALACSRKPAETIMTYQRAGGAAGPRVREALGRTTGVTLMWLAFSMWLSLGHRAVTEERQAAASDAVPGIVRSLAEDLDSLDSVAAELFG